MPDDDEGIDSAAEKLYAVLPADFVAARNARVKEVRTSGDDGLAAQIKALRRPSAAAWLVNLLARSDQSFDEFGDLSARLRDAQTRLDAPRMKELGQERSHVVNELVERAVDLAKRADSGFRDSGAVRDQVIATLIAAVADPTAEAAVTSGRLVSPLSYAGFGEVDLTDAVATPLHVVRQQDEKTDTREQAEVDSPAQEVDQRALARARDDLEQTEERLEEAEEAYDRARSDRHQARLDVKRAQVDVDELEGR